MGIFDFFGKKKHNHIREDEQNEFKEEEFECDKFEEVDNENFNYKIDIEEVEHLKVNEIEYTYKDLSPEVLDEIIIEEILKVIDNYSDFETVQETVKEAVKIIGKNNAEVLKEYLKGRISKPQRLKKKYDELGAWSRAVENAVLTLLYGFEEAGVDELLKISVMQSEAKFKAINLLCKLAARGIEREKIIDSIIYIMRPLNEDEVLKILNFLSQIKNSRKIDRLLELYFKKFVLENNLECAYDTAINRINLRGYDKEDEMVFFKVLALYEGKLEADLILPGEKGIIDCKEVNEDLRVKAALSYYSLNKEDKEINYRLLYLKDNSLDEELRIFLSSVLK